MNAKQIKYLKEVDERENRGYVYFILLLAAVLGIAGFFDPDAWIGLAVFLAVMAAVGVLYALSSVLAKRNARRLVELGKEGVEKPS